MNLRQMRHLDLLALVIRRYPDANHMLLARMSRDSLVAWAERARQADQRRALESAGWNYIGVTDGGGVIYAKPAAQHAA